MRALLPRIAATASLSLLLAGCATPGAVSAFSSSAVTTLMSATAVFGDMQASCEREIRSRSEIGSFKFLTRDNAPDSFAACDDIGKQAGGASAAAQILADYFNAINGVASFGTAKVATDAQNLSANTAAALGAGTPAQTAIGSIVSLLTSAATSGYQTKKLEEDLNKAAGAVANVVNALVPIVQNNYEGGLLKSEEQKLADQYREFAAGKTPEFKLTLIQNWRAEEQAIESRRASAQSLVSALRAVSKGLADLAANSRKLTAKELPGVLAPYVAQLQTLIPQIQKGF
jgi:hypothetical protein